MNGTTVKDYSVDIPGEVIDGQWVFPQLKYPSRGGAELTWKIIVQLLYRGEQTPILIKHIKNTSMDKNYRCLIYVQSTSSLGNIRANEPTEVNCGKNIGSSNETNVLCQALKTALSRYNAQKKKSAQPGYPSPMLASIYNPSKIKFPLWVQRKYNGVRAICTLEGSNAIFYSRKGVFFQTLGVLPREAKKLLSIAEQTGSVKKKLYLDGELYKHGLALQETVSLARREHKGEPETQLHYMIYDCFDPTEKKKQNERFDDLRKIFSAAEGQIENSILSMVDTFLAANEEEVDEYFKRFLREGYEGAIVRQNECYEQGVQDYHSRFLQKVKPAHDEEYEIVDYKFGENGRAKGAVILVCVTSDGQRFNVSPAVPLAERIKIGKEIAENFKSVWLGRLLTVIFDEKSKAGVPLRGRTKLVIRSPSSM